jgi:hypothetical protein
MEQEKLEVFDLLKTNYLEELKKKDLSKFERYKVLKLIMEENDWSERRLAKAIDKNHSTVNDWLLFGKIGEKKYNQLKAKGFKDTEIYRNMRDNKDKTIEEIEFIHYDTTDGNHHRPLDESLDIELKNCIDKLKSFISKDKYKKTDETPKLVHELKMVLNKIWDKD